MSRKFWTEEESQFLRTYYRQRGARWCAGLIQREIKAVYAQANKLGLAKSMIFVSDADLCDAIKRLYPQGWSDAEIAGHVATSTGIAVDRHRVGQLRRSMGFTVSNALSEHRRSRVAARTREQVAAAGLSSLADVRTSRWNAWKRKLGWPEHLSVRAVQALELFYAHGNLTRVQLCQLLGVSSRKRTAPISNHPGGTVLAELQQAGLITRLPKAVKIDGSVQLHDNPCQNSKHRKRANRVKYIDLYFLNLGVAPNGEARKHTAAG